MELSAYIREQALKIPGKQQLIMTAFAKSLEIIPRQICDNAGLDSTDILNKLRQRHAQKADGRSSGRWYGVDVDGPEGIRDNYEGFVWEPSLIKTNAIGSAAEAACLILSIDETIRGPQSEGVRALLCGHTNPTNEIFTAKSWAEGSSWCCCASSAWKGTRNA
jgi:T-complex protein 1 subunit eta